MLLAVGATLLAAASVPVARAQESRMDPRIAAVNELLDARASAQLRKDRETFARTIDPQAPEAFRAAQLASFDNLSALPVASLDYDANVDVGGDLSRGARRADYGGAEVFIPETVRRMRFPFDGDRAWIDEMWWTYVERDGRWYVGGDDDLVDVGLEPTVSMWDRGPVVMVQSAHVALIAHPQDRARAEALVGLAEQALATIAERWSLPWAGTLVGFLPEGPEELTELIQAAVDVTKFVAFVSYTIDTETLESSAPRLFVQDDNFGRYPAATQIETLVHEFVHAAGSRYAGAYTPSWVHEGLAEWVAIGPGTAFRRGSGSGDTVPRDDQFGAGSQAQIVQAYRDSRSLIASLARIAGSGAPYELFKRLGDERVRPGSRAYVLDETLRGLGVGGVADLEAKWRDGQ